jgi:septal ring factor EnvC (AmiA/AmiB activator)
MLRRTALICVFVFALFCAPTPCDKVMADDIGDRLAASRAALLAQERDIQRAYDDVTHRIDELKQKQTVLDQYLRATDESIRAVEKAMHGG